MENKIKNKIEKLTAIIDQSNIILLFKEKFKIFTDTEKYLLIKIL